MDILAAILKGGGVGAMLGEAIAVITGASDDDKPVYAAIGTAAGAGIGLAIAVAESDSSSSGDHA